MFSASSCWTLFFCSGLMAPGWRTNYLCALLFLCQFLLVTCLCFSIFKCPVFHVFELFCFFLLFPGPCPVFRLGLCPLDLFAVLDCFRAFDLCQPLHPVSPVFLCWIHFTTLHQLCISVCTWVLPFLVFLAKKHNIETIKGYANVDFIPQRRWPLF